MAEYCRKQDVISRTITRNIPKKIKQNSGHVSEIVQRVIVDRDNSLTPEKVYEILGPRLLSKEIIDYINELIKDHIYHPISEVVFDILRWIQTNTPPALTKKDKVEVNDLSKEKRFEEAMGTLLLRDPEVLTAAEHIHNVLKRDGRLTDAQIAQDAQKKSREGALPHVDFWAGAAPFVQGLYKPHEKKTVDGEVYAATQYEEVMMSGYWKRNYPPNNILAMRNMIPGFSFDMPIEDSDPSSWTQQDIDSLYAAYSYFPIWGKISVKDFYQQLSSLKVEERKKAMLDMHIRYSRSTNLAGENLSPLNSSTNPNGSGTRQSYSGGQYNLITFKPYEENANLLHKPTLSGPSGTAFRFIYAYNELIIQKGIRYPTIQDALLVTMANLLPPNGHHSYHEIMDGVHGVGGLRYTDPAGYTDINNIKPRIVAEASELSQFNLQIVGATGKKHHPQNPDQIGILFSEG